jgi:hypothetical protein
MIQELGILVKHYGDIGLISVSYTDPDPGGLKSAEINRKQIFFQSEIEIHVLINKNKDNS